MPEEIEEDYLNWSHTIDNKIVEELMLLPDEKTPPIEEGSCKS